MRTCVPVLLLRLLNMFRDYIFGDFFIETCHAKQCQFLVNGCHLVYSHFTQGVAKTQGLNLDSMGSPWLSCLRPA